MTRFTTAAVATIIALAASAGAHAQTGFYVTGSAGFAKPRDAGIKNDPDSGDALLNRGASLNDLDRSPVWTLGVGYRFSPLLRADLTVGVRNGLDLSDGEGNTNSAASTAGRNDVTAKIRSRAAFLTGYLDGGSFMPAGWTAFNPYVGIGIGRAMNDLSDLRVRNESVANGVPADTTNRTPSGKGTGIAWQLAAGVGIAVTSNLTFDVGYRYVDLGAIKVDRGRYDYPTFTPAVDTNALKGDLRTHEFAVGLRYSF